MQDFKKVLKIKRDIIIKGTYKGLYFFKCIFQVYLKFGLYDWKYWPSKDSDFMEQRKIKSIIAFKRASRHTWHENH